MRVELSLDAVSCKDVACGAVLPCRDDDRDVLLTGCKYPAVLWVNLVVLLENSAAQKSVDDFIRQKPLALCLHVFPYFEKVVLQTAECLFFRNAGISDTVHVFVEELFFLLRSEVPVAWYPVVVGVRHEVHDVFLKVVGRAGYDLEFVLTNHFGKRNSEFRGAHRACHGKHHFPAFVNVFIECFGCVYQCRRIEMAVMVSDEL